PSGAAGLESAQAHQFAGGPHPRGREKLPSTCQLPKRSSPGRQTWPGNEHRREYMNPFQRYLLDEFVEDYRGGEMSRRDFLMKVIGVSGGLAAAMGLFSSVGLSAAEVAAAQTTPRVAQAGPNPVTISPDDPDISVSDAS